MFDPVLNLSTLNGSNGFVINGIDGFDYSGYSVSNAGDINGDSIDDLIIGAYLASPNGNNVAGESYVVFGGAGVGSGGSLNLSELNGSNGFVINGIDEYDVSGSSVSSAGDINGDGIDDLIIGAPSADPNSTSAAGESYVVFGGVGVGAEGSLNLSALNGNGFVINGIDEFDQSGFSVSSAGDINGDGIDDLIIGASAADPNVTNDAGESYVVFGGVGVGNGGGLNLSNLDGSNGFVIKGIDDFDYSGISVSSAGDINGDGIDDLIIGAPSADPNVTNDAGESYVVFGGTGVGEGGSLSLSNLNGSNGFVINGIDVNDFSGSSVSSAGDINGDGIDDLIIGASGADPNGIEDAGESYVVFGKVSVGAGGSLNLSDLNGSNGFVINGIDVNDESGFSVSSAGDINSDGIDDLIIGTYQANPNSTGNAGENYVVFGGADVGSGGSLNLSALNGSNGFVIEGIDAEEFSGFPVSSAGDINNDGIDDLLIGAYGAAPNGNYSAGQSYVVFGRANDPNLAPDAINDSGFTANQSTSLVISTTALLANDTDPDANTVLRVTAVGSATGGSVALSKNDTPNNFADDFITFTPNASFDGLASFVYTLSDGSLSDTATVSIAVGKTVTGGNSKDTLIGTAGNDNLNGGNGDDRLVGGAGGDGLTGGNGADTFVISSLGDSLLSNFDRITDLKIGTDVIDGPTAVSAANVAELGAVASLTQAGLSAVLTAAAFGANRAATFSLGSRTFVALNNNTAGFQEASDAVVEITGFSGSLTSLAIA